MPPSLLPAHRAAKPKWPRKLPSTDAARTKWDSSFPCRYAYLAAPPIVDRGSREWHVQRFRGRLRRPPSHGGPALRRGQCGYRWRVPGVAVSCSVDPSVRQQARGRRVCFALRRTSRPKRRICQARHRDGPPLHIKCRPESSFLSCLTKESLPRSPTRMSFLVAI
jgi:hypothetical protein